MKPPIPASDIETKETQPIERRDFIKFAMLLAGGGALSPSAQAEPQDQGPTLEITIDSIAQVAKLAGLEFTEKERSMMLAGVKRNLESFAKLRALEIPNSVQPAVHFSPNVSPLPEAPVEFGIAASVPEPPSWSGSVPSGEEDLAFLPVWKLSHLTRDQKVSPVQLARLFLDRLKSIGPKLNCTVNLMEDSALAAAGLAEEEIKNGHYRGALHGIPWGAKDLFATRDALTTWGAKPFENQKLEEDATVVRKLRDQGAILVAKLSLGELAMGDIWFNGRTNNPWNIKSGSSGSSAGPAAATAAGLVPFAIGTETLGSIVSPCTACGVTGLRPTFGRVGRGGAMALSWSMDKIGPIARSVEDCALIFSAVHGADPNDLDAVTRPFNWSDTSRSLDVSSLRIGCLHTEFDALKNPADRALNEAALKKFEELGAKLIPIELPDFPVEALRMILDVEAATAFDELTRTHQDQLLKSQHAFAWPNVFRVARTVPGVEYLRAQRARTLLMKAMASLMANLDLFIAPSLFGDTLTLTNLTGHPSVVIPHGFVNNMPRSISLIGNLYGEEKILAAALAYQSATDWHLKRPPL